MTPSTEELENKTVQWEDVVHRMILKKNGNKIKDMKWTDMKFQKGANRKLYNFEEVDTFKYLETNI